MNKLTHEDAMRALTWYEVVCKNIGSATMPYDELKAIADLIREKDEKIKAFDALIALKDSVIEKHEAYIDNLNDDKADLVEQIEKQDAEIEKLKHSKRVAQVNIIDEIGNRMQAKAFNSHDIATGYFWAINDLLKLLLELKKKVMKGETDG